MGAKRIDVLIGIKHKADLNSKLADVRPRKRQPVAWPIFSASSNRPSVCMT
jgi:hypothetical protein